MGLWVWFFFISQGQSGGLQQRQPFFECPLPCPAGMIEFIPSVNAARESKVCISRKHNTKKTMNAGRQIELIEGRKKHS
jgi:hypothetical protein